jgi:hypothetical protein
MFQKMGEFLRNANYESTWLFIKVRLLSMVLFVLHFTIFLFHFMVWQDFIKGIKSITNQA